MPAKSRRRFLKVSSAAALCAAIDMVVAKSSRPLESERMPALFIGHGSPLNAILENDNTDAWKRLGAEIPKPRVILAVSAHWQSRGAAYITAGTAPSIIYDIYGFPDELYKVKYPARGAPHIVPQVVELLDQTVIGTKEWGLDHGTWLVLKHMYPKADIPVVQLSINANLSPEEHLEVGKQLSVLRQKGVLIMGSGNIVHNLQRRKAAGSPVLSWADEFDQIVVDRVEAGDFSAVCDYKSLGSLANLAHPTSEHFIPLLYTLGAMSSQDEMTWFNANFYKSSISMRCLSLA